MRKNSVLTDHLTFQREFVYFWVLGSGEMGLSLTFVIWFFEGKYQPSKHPAFGLQDFTSYSQPGPLQRVLMCQIESYLTNVKRTFIFESREHYDVTWFSCLMPFQYSFTALQVQRNYIGYQTLVVITLKIQHIAVNPCLKGMRH